MAERIMGILGRDNPLDDMASRQVFAGRIDQGVLAGGPGAYWPDTPADVPQLTQAIPDSDRRTVRELAKRVAELAASDANAERIARATATNGLKPGRPIVWIHEIPWHEMGIGDELELRCTSDLAREMEQHFRRILYRWAHIQVDTTVESAFYVEKAFDDTGIGLYVKEETRAVNAGPIISHHYENQLETEQDLDKVKDPVITARPEFDPVRLAAAEDLLGGVMPVKLRGYQIYCPPWDSIARFRGVEDCLIDMLDRPEFTHHLIGRFTGAATARLDQMEAQGLLDFDIPSLHETPHWCDELPAPDWDGGRVRYKDVWYRGQAQLFSSASPAMREEYDLNYQRDLMSRCGLVYYGCCEPLDQFIPYLKTVPNMRKIGVVPWANLRSSAEQMGGAYVMARKANPALLSGRFDAAAIEAEFVETIEVALEYGCPYEIVLKDLSTVGGTADNLIQWATIADQVVGRYY